MARVKHGNDSNELVQGFDAAHGSDQKRSTLNEYKNDIKGFSKTVAARYFSIMHELYKLLYVMGIQTFRISKCTAQIVTAALAAAFSAAGGTVAAFLAKATQPIRTECKQVKQGVPIAARRLKKAWRKGPAYVVPEFGAITRCGFRRHRKFFTTALNYMAPIGALAILVLVIGFWSNAKIALAVKYNGQVIGYVQDESVFDTALLQAQEQVVDIGSSFSLPNAPEFIVTIVKNEEIADENKIREEIIVTSQQQEVVKPAVGITVDGQFLGAVSDSTPITVLLDDMLQEYDDPNDDAETAFINDIQMQEGLYPAETVKGNSELEEKLTGNVEVPVVHTIAGGETAEAIAQAYEMSVDRLSELNPDLQNRVAEGNQLMVLMKKPFLDVQLIRTEIVLQDVAFKQEIRKDDTRPVGVDAIVQKGENGQDEVRYRVVYINGEVSNRTVESTITLKAPVNEVLSVGTKTDTAATTKPSGSAVPSGTFIWPTAATTSVGAYGRIDYTYSDGYHGGLDIFAPYGTGIFASDGGVVTQAGWYGNYGYLIVIDHGNDFVTYYAHCSSLYVSVGQTVAQGQLIGGVGETGYAYGNHLHFEVRYKGDKVDPMDYI